MTLRHLSTLNNKHGRSLMATTTTVLSFILIMIAIIMITTVECRQNWMMSSLVNSNNLFPLQHGETVEGKIAQLWNLNPKNSTIRYLYRVHLRYSYHHPHPPPTPHNHTSSSNSNSSNSRSNSNELENDDGDEKGWKNMDVFRDVILVDQLLTFGVVKLNNDHIVGNNSYFSLVNDDSFQDELIQLRQKQIDQDEFDHVLEIVFVSVAIAIPGVLGLGFCCYLMLVLLKSGVRNCMGKQDAYHHL